MRNAGLDELQARIKIGRRNINDLRYADNTTLMVESKEELKKLLMKVKEESERAGSRLNIKINKFYFCIIDCPKAFDCVDHNKLWKILKDMGIPDHLTCLMRNLYAGQEATVGTIHETMD